jgi:hypothetical protein
MKQLVDKTAIELETISGKKLIRDARYLGVSPLSTNVTPQQLLQGGHGVFNLGMYKGNLAVVDLDKSVNQPLVAAEKLSMLGQLDGKLLGYDYNTVNAIAAAAIGTVYRVRLTVPAGQVWYVHNVQVGAAKDTTCTFDINWRCSLWPDVVATGGTPDADGQTFFDSDIVGTNAIMLANSLMGVVPVTTNQMGLGHAISTLKTSPSALRLPAGAVITAQFTVRTNVVILATVACDLRIGGYVGKALVS